MNPAFSFRGKLLVLRLNKLRHTPPALYGTQILSEKSIPTLVFEFSNDHKTNQNLVDGIPTRQFGAPIVRYFPSLLRSTTTLLLALFYLIRNLKRDGIPKFILSHGLQEQLVAWVLHRTFRIPYAAHIHEIYDPSDVFRLNRVLLWMEKYFLRSATFTIFPTAERAQIYRKRYNLKNLSYVVFNTPRKRTHGGTHTPYASLPINQNAKKVLFIGGVGPLNGVRECIEAMAHVPAPNVLIVAGWGDAAYVKELKTTIKNLGLIDRVFLVGPIKNKWDWIENADLGICLYQNSHLRSRYNAGASNKLFEFISAGVPVLTNNAPDFKALVEHFGLGICARSFSPEDIAHGIKSVLTLDTVQAFSQKQKYLNLHTSLFNYEKQFEPVTTDLQNRFAA